MVINWELSGKESTGMSLEIHLWSPQFSTLFTWLSIRRTSLQEGLMVLVPKLSNYHELTINTEFSFLQPHMYRNSDIVIFSQHSNLWSRSLPNVLQKGLPGELTTLFHLANLQSSHPHEMEACAIKSVKKNKQRQNLTLQIQNWVNKWSLFIDTSCKSHGDCHWGNLI